MAQKSSSCAQPWREGDVSSPYTTLRLGNNVTKKIGPGQHYCLALVASSTEDGVIIELRTASAQEFEQICGLQQRLGGDPSAWDQQIQALLASGGTPSNANRALAAQLLFSQQAPPSPSLEQLRNAQRRNNCTTPSGTRP